MRQVGDFFNIAEEKFLTLEEFNETYNCRIDFLTWEGLRKSVTNGINKVNSASIDYNDCYRPRLPIFLQMLGGTTKGCQAIYRTLVKKQDSQTRGAENKWHGELNTLFSIKFWNSIWKIPKTLDITNKQRFMQIQINNHVLPTNYTVSKHNPLTSPECTFCNAERETLSHLFFDCIKVQGLYRQIEGILITALSPMTFLKKYCLFGYDKLKGSNKENLMSALCRAYIWKQKAKKSSLCIASWKAYIRADLEVKKACININKIDEVANFEYDWGALLLHLEP